MIATVAFWNIEFLTPFLKESDNDNELTMTSQHDWKVPLSMATLWSVIRSFTIRFAS